VQDSLEQVASDRDKDGCDNNDHGQDFDGKCSRIDPGEDTVAESVAGNELQEQCTPLIDPLLGLLSALVLLSVPCPTSESGPDPSCSPGQIPHLRRD
jgi:hypothetical protein